MIYFKPYEYCYYETFECEKLNPPIKVEWVGSEESVDWLHVGTSIIRRAIEAAGIPISTIITCADKDVLLYGVEKGEDWNEPMLLILEQLSKEDIVTLIQYGWHISEYDDMSEVTFIYYI